MSPASALRQRNLPVDPTADYPDVYALICSGDCMAPEIPDGSKVSACRSEPYRIGDLVIVHMLPEFVKPGAFSAIVKRIAMPAAPWVKGYPHREHPKSECQAILGLSMNSMPGKMMMVPCRQIGAVHLVVGMQPPGTDRYSWIGRLKEDGEAAARVIASIKSYAAA